MGIASCLKPTTKCMSEEEQGQGDVAFLPACLSGVCEGQQLCTVEEVVCRAPSPSAMG